MQRSKTISEAYAQRIWEQRDLAAIDELVDPGVVIHSALGPYHGQEAMRQVVKAWHVAFPDLKVDTINAIEEDERTVLQWRAEGTHLGEFKGIAPTGNRVAYEGVTVYRVQEDRIIEYWAYLDMRILLQQLRRETPFEELIALEKDARAYGFDWPNHEIIIDQAISEAEEIREALAKKEPPERVQEEIGDLIHTGISLCLYAGFNVEETIERVEKKFGARMQALKQLAKQRGMDHVRGQSFDSLLELWKEAKISAEFI